MVQAKWVLVCSAVVVALMTSAAQASSLSSPSFLQYLSETDYVTGYQYQGSTVGGLSGIDYDARTNTFISQSDHGSNGEATHYYSLTPTFTNGSPGYGLSFTGVHQLGPDDIESIRYDPNRNGVWFTTEGTLPTIYHMAANGTTTTIPTPANIATRSQINSSFEGSTFTPNGSYVVSVENALYGDATDLTRITKFNKDGSVAAQYAYWLDTLPGIANPPDVIGGTNNGVSDILAISNTSFLVLERAFDGVRATTPPEGESHNSIRIYRVDLTGATDVQNITDLTDGSGIKELDKTLIFDSSSLAGTLDTYETKVDNIEGMSFGPKLADGDESLVLVSDNNYSKGQGKTQFLVFNVDPSLSPVSVVPLPAGLPMFGSALLILAVFGFGLNRKSNGTAQSV